MNPEEELGVGAQNRHLPRPRREERNEMNSTEVDEKFLGDLDLTIAKFYPGIQLFDDSDSDAQDADDETEGGSVEGNNDREQRSPISLEMHHDGVKIYYAYKDLRFLRFVLRLESEDMEPEHILFNMSGSTQLKMSTPNAQGQRKKYELGPINEALKWYKGPSANYVVDGSTRSNNSFVRVEHSRVTKEGHFIFMEIAITPRNVALFPPHLKRPNIFELSLECHFPTLDPVEFTVPSVEIFAKPHGCRDDVPQNISKQHSLLKTQFDTFRNKV